MENGLILCKLALRNFGNVFLLTLLIFLINTFSFLETGSINKEKSTGRPKKKNTRSRSRSAKFKKAKFIQNRFRHYHSKFIYPMEPAI
ncbi:hypothetical protein BDFB_011195 [Asbolus verrucosus]|uniref:Uncharacterized protein n=1 Tax=Asbolus verrucosus TaxID=1661398 RepID=A0A482VQY8_ASBVE|nr:hypothetical protein BDFB_011195 [Asbolus verrucosus]